MAKETAPRTRSCAIKGTIIQDFKPSRRSMSRCAGLLAAWARSSSAASDTSAERRVRITAGTPQRHGGEDEGRGRGVARAEPEGRPDQRRNRNEIDRVVSRSPQQNGPEYELAYRHQRQEQETTLDQPPGPPAQSGALRPEDQERGEERVTCRVGEPPRQPDREGIAPGHEAAEDE